MKYFDEFKSNTYAGSGNQLFFNMNEYEICTGRVLYKISSGGKYNYSMNEKDCTYEIISDTLNGFDSEMTDYYYTNGRPGIRGNTWWYMLFINHKIFRIGRLQFEIHKFK